jgi:hypothetical protein
VHILSVLAQALATEKLLHGSASDSQATVGLVTLVPVSCLAEPILLRSRVCSSHRIQVYVCRAFKHFAMWCRAGKKAPCKANANAMPADLDNTQIEDLIAEFAGDLSLLPGTCANGQFNLLRGFVHSALKRHVAALRSTDPCQADGFTPGHASGG